MSIIFSQQILSDRLLLVVMCCGRKIEDAIAVSKPTIYGDDMS